jgi:TolB protein
MKKIIPFVLLAFAISSCLPQDMRVPQSPLLSTLERKSGLIAYVGLDGNMYVSDQGGGKLQQLTDDAVIPQNQGDPVHFYQYPTWARDGNQVAFSGLNVQGLEASSTVIIANIDEESTKEVYSSQSEHPIYLYWSPDNENISFISATATNQNIILQTAPASGGERTIIDTGSPYYWSWAPDGNVMIVHTGSETSTSPDHLAFLRVDSGVLEQSLDSIPASFQAPAWSPDGSRIALARLSDNENQIIVTDSAGENPKTIGTFTNKTAFAWSSDSNKLAYLDSAQALAAGIVGAMHVYDMETSKETVVDQNIAAFFWSPSGEEIAYYVLATTNEGGSESADTTAPTLALQLNVLDVSTGESRTLFTYLPTNQFLSILPYFDQYHQSATIWSPDNNNLVLSFLDGEGNPGIAIVAASGQLEPRLLAGGYIAFWSWK